MPLDLFVSIAERVSTVVTAIVPGAVACAAAFTALTLFSKWSCNPQRPWWRSRGLLTDICYWFVLPFFAPYVRIGLLITGATLIVWATSAKDVATYLNEGQGLLSGLSFWPQAIIYFIASDFLLYWVHRLFHGASLWRYHAIHHSSEDVDWTTAYRWHPINIWAGPLLVGVIMLLLGIAPAVVIFFAPIDTVIAVFVHANLNWTLGPLKYVVATPVFHRWHHTLPGEGGQKNFAPTFAFWDVLFGTFYMPEGRMPERYGVDDPEFPRGFFGQLVYPFKTSPRPQATAPAPAASAADRV